jgi:hypothetical protein
MTRIESVFPLLLPFDDSSAEAIENVQSCYGIERIRIAPALDRITVDYDATRFTLADLERLLVRCGVPIALAHAE